MEKLCQYSDVFGKPREGLHLFRIPYVDLALVDVVLTVIGVRMIQKIFFRRYNYFILLFITFMLSLLLHWMFCVRTQLLSHLSPKSV